jgi:hypothetical protein
MYEVSHIGKTIILIGVVLAVIGGLILLLGKLPGWGEAFKWIGKLPGDIYVHREHFTFYFPLTTGIVISVALSLILIVLSTLLKR